MSRINGFLSGFKVVDLSRHLSGPLASFLLASLGFLLSLLREKFPCLVIRSLNDYGEQSPLRVEASHVLNYLAMNGGAARYRTYPIGRHDAGRTQCPLCKCGLLLRSSNSAGSRCKGSPYKKRKLVVQDASGD